jgi:phage terminase large subunit-like protein
VKQLSPKETAELLEQWLAWARPDQAPDDLWRRAWRHWLILGGRGAGKTRAGAEWIKAKVKGEDWTGAPARRIALVGATLDEARAVMVEGVSGLLAIHGDGERPHYAPSKRLLTWPGGAVAQLYSGEDPESLRGPQFDTAWCDELAKWRYPEASFDMLQFGLRLGSPQLAITTTPRPLPLLKRMIEDPAVVVSRAPTWANESNLAEGFIAEMRRRYEATGLGRQELGAEIIADDPDALFTRAWIERTRVAAAPELARIVVAIDPPVGRGPKGGTCGIIAAGQGADGRAYVLDDASVTGASPARWAGRAVALYHARNADRLVAEVNQGGAMVETVIRQVDDRDAFRAVNATRAKRARADPVAALYEQGRVSHVGSFPALEDQMASFTGESEASPDRLDALVWALSDLMLGRTRAEPKVWVL